MFLWRALSGALAIAERLNSRGMGVEPNCKICHGSTESINHVLFQCSAALQLWSGAGFTLPSFVMAHSLEENFSYVFNLMEDSNRPQSLIRTIPWVLWLIWKNRNSILYADTQESMERLLRAMSDEVEQWFLLNNTPSPATDLSGRLEDRDKWCPPASGFIKCNIHANWRNVHLHSGVAWIARDQAGNVSHHARDAIIHAPNHMVAELRCVIWALSSLRDLGVPRVIIAIDYHKVLEAINAPRQWPRFRDLVEQVVNFKEAFESLVFEGEKVSANGIPRDIAKSVLRDGRFHSYLALGGPSWLHDRIARENMGSDD